MEDMDKEVGGIFSGEENPMIDEKTEGFHAGGSDAAYGFQASDNVSVSQGWKNSGGGTGSVHQFNEAGDISGVSVRANTHCMTDLNSKLPN